MHRYGDGLNRCEIVDLQVRPRWSIKCIKLSPLVDAFITDTFDPKTVLPSEKRLSYRSSSISSDAIGFALCNAEPNIPLQRPRSRLSAMAGDVAELKLDALNMIVLLEHARALFGSIIR